VYPVLLGAGAVILGCAALALAKKNRAKIPISAILAIIIGILAIVINIFWLDIFPAPAVLPPVK
jgi:energy-converting hydrogenase Eha subunit C